MSDSIVYLVVSNGGGIDGRDHTDKGGKVLYASHYKESAEKKVTGWSHFEARVVDHTEICKKVVHKLDSLERMSMRIMGNKVLREVMDK